MQFKVMTKKLKHNESENITVDMLCYLDFVKSDIMFFTSLICASKVFTSNKMLTLS